MKKHILTLIACLFSIQMFSQHLVLKNNLLYDATLTPNLGLEAGLGKKTTLDINVGYNPFTFKEEKKFKHWLVQPEVRYWTCERFNGFFLGLHAHGGEFCVAGLDLPFGAFPVLKHRRYEGYLYGGGLSAGYQWILGKRWNFEASVGAGYARIHYDQYWKKHCSPKIKTDNYNYWGITKATVTFIFVLF